MGYDRSALHQISEIEHLRKAWRAISKRNTRSKGLDDVTIASFKTHLEDHLGTISADLRSNQYVFGKLRAHAINKPGSTKKRPLQREGSFRRCWRISIFTSSIERLRTP